MSFEKFASYATRVTGPQITEKQYWGRILRLGQIPH
jgi:hypothetical protein